MTYTIPGHVGYNWINGESNWDVYKIVIYGLKRARRDIRGQRMRRGEMGVE